MFTWSSLHHALVNIAGRVYPHLAERDVGQAYDKLVAERVRRHVRARPQRRLVDWLQHEGAGGLASTEVDLEELRMKFSQYVHDIFEEFAAMPAEAELVAGRHTPRADLPPSRQALSCERYLVLCSKFKIITEDGFDTGRYGKFTQEELLATFMDASAVQQADMVGGLTLEEFWDLLVRLSWLAAEKYEEQSGSIKSPKEEFIRFIEQICSNVRMDMGMVNRRVWRVCVALFEQAYQSRGEVTETLERADDGKASASQLYHQFCRYNSSGKMNRATFINFVVECQVSVTLLAFCRRLDCWLLFDCITYSPPMFFLPCFSLMLF